VVRYSAGEVVILSPEAVEHPMTEDHRDLLPPRTASREELLNSLANAIDLAQRKYDQLSSGDKEDGRTILDVINNAREILKYRPQKLMDSSLRALILDVLDSAEDAEMMARTSAGRSAVAATAEMQTQTKEKVEWTLEQAQRFMKEFQPTLDKAGFKAEIVGSVPNKGYSTKDLDILLTIVPERKKADDFDFETIMDFFGGEGADTTDEETGEDGWMTYYPMDGKQRIVDFHFGERFYLGEAKTAQVVKHPSGNGYAVRLTIDSREIGMVSSGAGPFGVGGGDIGQWATPEEALEKGTSHLKKDKWQIIQYMG
jgi:hypothetical protein